MSFFAAVDALVAKHRQEVEQARQELKRCGWTLRKQHPVSGMWRASRYIKPRRYRHGEPGQTLRLRAPTAAQLVALAQEEAAPRLKAREERRAKAEAKKAAKKEKAA